MVPQSRVPLQRAPAELGRVRRKKWLRVRGRAPSTKGPKCCPLGVTWRWMGGHEPVSEKCKIDFWYSLDFCVSKFAVEVKRKKSLPFFSGRLANFDNRPEMFGRIKIYNTKMEFLAGGRLGGPQNGAEHPASESMGPPARAAHTPRVRRGAAGVVGARRKGGARVSGVPGPRCPARGCLLDLGEKKKNLPKKNQSCSAGGNLAGGGGARAC